MASSLGLASPEQLLYAVRGEALRCLATYAGVHFEGLTQAARKVRLSSAMTKHLRHLDICTAWLRHVTQPKCQILLSKLQMELKMHGERKWCPP